MINLVRNKRVFYLCKKIKNTTTFQKPKKKFMNYQPRNSVGEMLSLGEEYSKYLQIKCRPEEAIDFNDKDRCYVYKKPPEIFDELCEGADYIVNGDPIITLNEAEINLIKLSGDLY